MSQQEKNPEWSVIVATYNRPNALRLCLEGFAAQTDTSFEMLIADDGSDEDTPRMVEAFAKTAPYPITFCTQEHSIFWKTRIVNQTVVKSRGERLLFCDGDCVPYRNFFALHKAYLRARAFCVGGYIHLDMEQSRRLDPEAVRAGAHQRISTFKQRGKLHKIHYKNLFYRLIGKRFKPRIMGGNFSVTRNEYYEVNGFDERYQGFGAEDSDMRNRLRNNGCAGISLWNKAFTCHLVHESLDPPRPNRTQTRSRRDPDLYYNSRDNLRAVEGVDQYLSE